MAKKRKAPAQPKGPREVDTKDARLGPITTYKDVADSEDEYFMNQDTIMMDDEPDSKRRRKDDDMELSEEEILADDSDDDGYQQISTKSKTKSKAAQEDDDDNDDDDDEEEEEDSGWWGSSKQEYYNADNIETEADAEEEEVEAKRLQKKKLAKMTEEDFMFDGDEWLAGEADEADARDTVTEVLKEVEITDDMSTEDRQKLLATRYPEFEYLVKEFEELQPVLQELKAEAKLASETSLESIKYWVLGCYIASLASYFALVAAPARDAGKQQKATDPAALRDHDVMETLVSCRNAWQKIQSLHSASKLALVEEEPASDDISEKLETIVPHKQKNSKKDAKAAAKQAKKAARAQEIEASVADLYDLPLTNGKASKTKKAIKAAQDDDNSDFGEEDELDARTAAEKAARKKSLKFYTSQIVQKANRRSGAGRDAGGDHDIPYRERLRDRQARLIAEAQKRGKKDSKHGAALGEDDSDDDNTANAMRDDENDYYDMMANASKDKKADKAARYAAYAAANKADRVVETEEIGEDGKRKINYKIEKNKGLTPKRGKDVRNPRVKKRKQYEAKQKKLKSMKPVWQGGEPKGGYRGELSGINTGVVKSIKL